MVGSFDEGTTRRPTVNYAMAMAATAAAFIVRALFDSTLGDDLPFLAFYFAVIVSAGRWGIGPGLTALALGIGAGAYFFCEPRFSFYISSASNQLNAFRFAAVGVAVSLVCEAMHRHQRQSLLQWEFLRTTLASIGDAVITTDAEGRVASLNVVAETMTGWTSAEAANQPLDVVFRIVNETSRQPVENPATRALKDGVVVDLTNHTILIAKDGSERAIDDNAALIRLANGSIAGCVLVFRDVSEQRATARRLAESEVRKAAIVHTALDCIITCDQEGRVVEFNPAAERTFGYSAADAAEQDLADLIIPPSRREGHRRGMARLLQTGQGRILGQRLEMTGMRADGSEFPIEFAVTAIRSGETSLFTAYLRDITARKQHEAELLERERQFHTLAESIPQLCWMADPDGSITWYNRRWYDYTGTDFKQMKGWGWQSVHDPEALPKVLKRWRLSLDSGERFDMVFPIRGKDGIFRSFLTLVEPVKDAEGRVVRWFGTNTDVTEQEQAESAVRAANAKFEAVFNQSGIFAGIIDLEGNLRRVNDLAVEACGYARDQVLDRPFWETPWWRGGSEKVRDATRQAANGAMFRDELRYWTADGSERVLDFALHPIRDEQGAVILLHSTGIDITERKRFERDLAEAHQFLQSSLDALSSHIAVLDENGVILAVNEAWRRFADDNHFRGHNYGIGANYVEECEPQGDECGEGSLVARGLLDVLKGRAAYYDLEYPCHSPTEDRWFMIRVTRFQGAEPVRVVVSHENVTQRKLAEDSLRRSEERERQRAADLEALMAAVPACVWIAHDPDCLRITGNRASSDFLRLPPGSNQSATAPEHERPKHFKVVKDGVDLLPHQLPVQMAARGIDVRDFEEDIVFDNGDRLHLFGHALPLRDGSGRVRGAVAAFMDITDRKRQEEETRRRSEQVRRLAEVATWITAASDTAAVISIVAEEARRLIGAHQSAVSLATDHHWKVSTNVVSLSDKYEGWRSFKAQRDGSGIYALACRLNHSMRLTQGELETHHAFKRFSEHAEDHPPLRGWLAAPLVGRDGRNIGLVQLSDKFEGDFTADDEAVLVQLAQMASVAVEKTRLVEDLRDADRRKNEFLATLAHELRNPLAPIRSGLEVMKLADGNARATDEARSIMERQLGQMVRLVNELMDLSRITQGKIELRKERVELAAVIQSAVETSRPLIQQMDQQLEVVMPERPIVLNADLIRLAQVFLNLLNNASKYSDRGSRISLVVEQQGNEAVATVKDSGIGIPAAHLPRIFEMFSQVEGALSRSQGGLGIGLCLVQRLVELHDGRVEARSEGVGQGSEFSVRLPIAKEAPMSQPTAAPSSPHRSALRILIVDDNEDGAESLAMMLGILGNETRSAYDGDEAVKAAEEFRPDVLLLDIGLPKRNGYEACRDIRKQPWGKDMVIIAQTGWGSEEDRRRTREAGFDHHLVKPVDPQDLIKLVADLNSAET